ncbi:MAG TPA: FecR domain-containing protein [Pseudomonadales bacterium]
MSEPDPLESLLRRAVPRPEPPADVRARVRAAVEREWRRQKRRRRRVPAALAAALVMTLGAVLWLARPAHIPVQVSHTDGLWIDGELFSAGGVALELAPETVLEAQGPTRLTASNRIEVRLREGTRVVWLEPELVTLERGTIYVDTHGRGHLRVRTALGEVRDIGTRYMVTLHEGAMEVALREGAAAIDTEHGHYTARARDRRGDVVIVSGERLMAAVEPASAERWAWIHDVHPGYSSREVLPLLRQIADDLGLALEFASPAVQAAALQGRLEGDISGLGPAEALEVVLGTSGFVAEQPAADRLLIGFPSAAD